MYRAGTGRRENFNDSPFLINAEESLSCSNVPLSRTRYVCIEFGIKRAMLTMCQLNTK